MAAVGLGIGFMLPAILNSSPQHLADTTSLIPEPAQPYWKPILYGGEPPSDVLGNLVVPQGVKSTGYDNLDGDVTQYDRSAIFFVAASKSDVIGFYDVELPALGWKIRGAAPTRDHKGTTVLAYRFSKDSYQWDVQVSAEPSTLHGRSGTKLTVEAYQEDDDES